MPNLPRCHMFRYTGRFSPRPACVLFFVFVLPALPARPHHFGVVAKREFPSCQNPRLGVVTAKRGYRDLKGFIDKDNPNPDRSLSIVIERFWNAVQEQGIILIDPALVTPLFPLHRLPSSPPPPRRPVAPAPHYILFTRKAAPESALRP